MDPSAPRDDYILNIKFSNSLPNAPSGPFLKNVKITHSFSDFPEYCTSTLEKNYIWQPHFGPDLGIKLDLVDQDTVLALDKADMLDQSDMRYLAVTAEKGRGKAKQIDDNDKPWWLRNTTYMENNLYNITKVKSKVAAATETISAKRPALDYDRDMLTTSFINESFDIVNKTVADLIAKNGNNALVRELSVVPIDVDGAQDVPFLDRVHSLVRFDEDPVVLATVGAEEGYSSSSSSASASKRRKVDTGIITNLRQTVKSTELRNEVLEVSLVSPLGTEAASQSELTDGTSKEVKYQWVKDYRMDVQNTQLHDSFLLVLPQPQSTSVASAEGQEPEQAAQYFPIHARVDMHKMNLEDSRPHDCTVVLK
jgi:hypothetical protein